MCHLHYRIIYIFGYEIVPYNVIGRSSWLKGPWVQSYFYLLAEHIKRIDLTAGFFRYDLMLADT